ncbi:MAG: hypothetical protein HWE07_04745 [Cytophagia bacterium]|nr:hypothetical protein [Cytophagia bacterium]
MKPSELEQKGLSVNDDVVGRIKDVSINEGGLYSCNIVDLDLDKFPELVRLLKSFDDTFLNLSLMLLDPIQDEITAGYEIKIGSTPLTYVHLTEGSRLGFRFD